MIILALETKYADLQEFLTGHYSQGAKWFKISIMCGITIGENAIVGAGAVVTKSVPAKVIRKI